MRNQSTYGQLASGGSRKLVRTALVLALSIGCIFPLYWMVVTALNPLEHQFDNPPVFLPNFENASSFWHALIDTPMPHWLANTTVISTGVAILSVIMGILAGYGLSRFRFHGKGAFGFILFATQMLPETLVVVPLYTMFLTLGLLNNLGSLVIADTAFIMPVVAWIMKAAIDGVPYEIEEAARVDGCSRLAILQIVVVPLVLPSVAAGAVIAFFYGWNDFLFALTLVNDPSNWTASVGVSSFIGQFVTPLDTVFAAATIYTLVPVVFYLLAQRRLISGLTSGAVKG